MSRESKSDKQLIYGRNPVIDALDAGKSFERIYLKDSLTGIFEKEVRKRCSEQGIPLKKVPQIKLDKLSRNRNHQGIVGLGSIIQYQDLDMVIPHIYEKGEDPLIVMLDNIQDVRNIGAIARSAETLGAHGLILSGSNTGMITHDSLKVSTGALTRLLVSRMKSTLSAFRSLKGHGIKIVGTSLQSNQYLFDSSLEPPVCIVLGSEHSGLHRSVEQQCDLLVKIPQQGKSNSLNVSVAAGIMLYEIERQRIGK